MRTKLLVAGAALALAILPVAAAPAQAPDPGSEPDLSVQEPVAAAADTTCPTGYACAWRWYEYQGGKRLIGAEYGGTGWHTFEYVHGSAKNRFDNRAIYFLGYPTEPWKCLNPGQNDPYLFSAGAQYFLVTGLGGRC